MAYQPPVGEGAVAATLLGVVLLNRPVVDLFDYGASIAGIPTLVAYIFAAWAVLIGLLAWTMRSRVQEPPQRDSER